MRETCYNGGYPSKRGHDPETAGTRHVGGSQLAKKSGNAKLNLGSIVI